MYGGRICYFLTNFIPDISEPNSKRFIYKLLNDRLPSAGQATQLYHLKSLVQAFFTALNIVLISVHIRKHIQKHIL